MDGFLGNAIVITILAVVVFFIVKSIIKDKRNGKSPACGGDCSKCGGACSYNFAPPKTGKK
jgi:hypothetical protein